MADRLAGGVLGVGEGALVASLLVVALLTFLGPQHPLVQGSRSLALFEGMERMASEPPTTGDVAAAPLQ